MDYIINRSIPMKITPMRFLSFIFLCSFLLGGTACQKSDYHKKVVREISEASPEASSISKVSSSTASLDFKACSYDGAPVRLNPSSFRTPQHTTAIIDEIMSYVGLPQNFIIYQTEEVPNAAAVIVADKEGIPQRIIAYNPDFMELVMKATQSHNWSPISIMAHEIGHHLCGHTITPGGSQPPLELESDKFSGFVLQKMGAMLSDAQKAMETLSSEEKSETHPPRSQRLSAIKEGWLQACKQNTWADCSNPNAPIAQKKIEEANGEEIQESSSNPNPDPIQKEKMQSETPVEPQNPKPQSTRVVVEQSRAQEVNLPRISQTNIPSKFDRFIYDETGLLSSKVRRQINAELKRIAEEEGIEIVTLLTSDLQGMDMESYAYKMMHLLRIGRMDIGNGACLVLDPQAKKHQIALMPGLRFSVRQGDLDLVGNLANSTYRYIEMAEKMPRIREKQLELAGEWILKMCKNIRHAATGNFRDWTIYFQSVADMEKAYEEKMKNYDFKKRESIKDDPVYKKMLSFRGKVVSNEGPIHNEHSAPNIPEGGRAVEVQLGDGTHATLLLNSYSENMYPSEIKKGNSYFFIAREAGIALRSFQLISYDQVKGF